MTEAELNHYRACSHIKRTALDMYLHDKQFRRRFEEWKEKRQGHGALTATNETRAAPPVRPQSGAVATV